MYRAAIITASDKGAAGQREDLSGPAIRELLEATGEYTVTRSAVLPDERGEIRNCDFFGGNLAGIEEKLDYLQSLGVSTLYLCPIFEADSNHRYNTGDYDKIDPMLGTESDFRRLCAKARERGIRVMLDGVFNHTGNNSRYFNAYDAYPSLGAAQSWESPYISWYTFREWPVSYESWWGIHTLPAVNENDPGYINFIVEGKDSVIRRWLRAGASGWRRDVADELPDEFIEQLRAAVEETDPDAMVIGEVWEDASNKIAYSVRRKHVLGGHCDGVMNYPVRNGILGFLLGEDGSWFRETVERQRQNYPHWAFHSGMNSLGTHDTPRILTLLGEGSDRKGDTSRDWRCAHRLSHDQRALAVARLKLGSLLLYALPGSPTVYYGDEAGMEGAADPFNRRTYPWGHENQALLAWFRRLGQLRKDRASLRRGELRWLEAQGPLLAFGDSAVCTDPDADQLASIAIAACDTVRALVGWEPRCALLSYSTCGSGEGPLVDKVVEAVKIAQNRRPDLAIDGEFQLDSAISPKVAAKKVRRESRVAGRANIIIWSDLNVGNVGVKLVQQFARADAYGPMLQGFAKIVCDCSRGAPVSELVGNIAMSCVRAQGVK